MNSKEYWDQVGKLRDDLVTEFTVFQKQHQESENSHLPFISGQPANGKSKFLTSVRNHFRNTTAGTVVEADTKLAAKCIFDGTHRLSTHEEVGKYLEERAAEYNEHKNIELGRKQQVVVYTTPAPSSQPSSSSSRSPLTLETKSPQPLQPPVAKK